MYNHCRFSKVLTLLALLLIVVKVAVAAEPGPEAKVLVKEIRITGAEAIPAAELQPIVAPFIGKEMDLADLRKVADSITGVYQARGYNLARAILPEQDLSGGVVEIRVLEARIGKVAIQGNKYYSTPFIEGAFAGVMGYKAVKQSSLEETLLRLRDQYPDLKVSAALKTGDDPGTTDIAISALDTFPVHFTIDYNNFGVPTVSRHILGTELWSIPGLAATFVLLKTKHD